MPLGESRTQSAANHKLQAIRKNRTFPSSSPATMSSSARSIVHNSVVPIGVGRGPELRRREDRCLAGAEDPRILPGSGSTNRYPIRHIEPAEVCAIS